MAGKALCQDPSQRDGKIKTKSLRKRRLFSMEWFPTGRGALAFVPRRSCLPLTREVASPKGLTEGEIDRACCEVGMRRAYGLRILSLSRLRRQLPRQREPRAGIKSFAQYPLRRRTGGSGGHFALGAVAPRRPFCPLSAGGKWTNAPPRKRGGGPVL